MAEEYYDVSLPCQELTFSNTIIGDFMKKDIDNVFKKGISMFSEVENALKKMGSQFSNVENMLKQEKDRFEDYMQRIKDDGNLDDDWVYKPLHLNVVHWELLLESCVWDQRLYSLKSSDHGITDEAHGKEGSKNAVDLKVNPDVSLESNDPKENLIKDLTERSTAGDINNDRLFSSTQMAMGRIVPITGDVAGDLKGNPFSVSSKQEDPKGWMWTPFPDIRQGYMNDLQSGYLPKFEPLDKYSPESKIHQLISEEGTRLHFPLGKNDYIVSDYEDELSSIIACALTLLTNSQIPTQDVSDDTKSYDEIHSVHNVFSEEPQSNEGLGKFDSVVYLGSPHPVVSMGRLAGKSKYSVACLYASQFLHLRKQCGLSEPEYIASLSRCENWDAKGGKSKAVFAKTLDGRFIIKEIKKTEFRSFMVFASDFFEYMSQCFEVENQTCLAKILGIYQVRKRKSGIRHDLMVMENLTYGRQNISRQYDLKGALHARFTNAADGQGDVLLDQNFVNDMKASPYRINRRAKRKLKRAVWNDIVFLNSINVMDYSLLVGVDTEKKELVCGIIDYLRQYTLDKQLESWVKSSLVPKNQSPTVISPLEYKKRFRMFIDTHFLIDPDDCGPGKEKEERANKMGNCWKVVKIEKNAKEGRFQWMNCFRG